ncbi:MAG: acetate--CoA ligase family protein [Hyphomicrobiaceae bacterium]
MTTSLSRLLAPRSIAVFGGNWAERVVEQCQKMGFPGEVWPVHPTKDAVHGVRCYRSVGELPGAPDASFVAVNRNLAVEVMGELSARGAGGAVCFAAGFKEAGPEGAALQDRLVAASGAMPFLGPNCYGLINYIDGALLWPDQHGGQRTERGVAILMQSGNIALNMTMNQRGVPLAYLAALGNQARIDLADLIVALADTGRVSAVGMLIEGIPDTTKFAAAVEKARAAGVPVVALKAGRTEHGAQLAMSHTGSLAGSDAVMDAYLRRLGVARVDSLTVFLETLKLLHVHGPLPGRDVVSMSCSGGEALLIADAARHRQVDFRPFTPADVARIRPTTNPIVSISNPFDYHTFDWGRFDRLEATFTEVQRSGFDLGMIVMDLPRGDRCTDGEWKLGIDAFAKASKAAGGRAAVLSTLVECMPESYALELIGQGVAPMMGIDETLTAIEHAAFIGTAPADGYRPLGSEGPDPTAVFALTEWEGKQALKEHGLQIPAGDLVHTELQAIAAANVIGYPLVVKAVSGEILHKTEAGAVRLGIRNEDDLVEAMRAMAHLSDEFLIEEMVTDAVAELIVGVTRDPQIGPVLVVGSGGVLVELIADAATLMLPARPEEVRQAIGSLRGANLLKGFRGKPEGDIEAVVDAVMAIAHFAVANAGRIAELDVNPLLVRPKGRGAVAVDALVRMSE